MVQFKNCQKCPVASLIERNSVYEIKISEDFDESSWFKISGFNKDKEHFFSPQFISAMNSNSSVKLFFVEMLEKKRTMGVAIIGVTNFYGQPLERFLPQRGPLIELVGRYLKLLNRRLEFKLLVSGNPLSSGETGLVLADDCNKAKVIRSIIKAAGIIENKFDNIQGWVLKDFLEDSEFSRILSEECSLTRCITDPDMVFSVESHWHNFDDYLESLQSKYRVKARRAYSKSNNLRMVSLSSEDLQKYGSMMESLYSQVLNHCDYYMGRLNGEMFEKLKSGIGSSFIVDGYFLGDKLVGFKTAHISSGNMKALWVGFDYGFNQEHGIYSRILYDYVKLGIDLKAQTIDFGRTATEMKSCLGARPRQMVCFIRQSSFIMNLMMKFLASKIIFPVQIIRDPFKKEFSSREMAG